MAREVRVGRVTYLRDRFSTPVNFAFDAYEEVGQQPWGQLAPKLRLASFVRDLPEATTALAGPTNLVLDLGMALDPATLDGPPRIDCVHGPLPIVPEELEPRLAALNGAWRGGGGEAAERAKRHLAAAAQFLGHLEPVHKAYRNRCESVWSALRQAEWVATDIYFSHLARSREIARRERDRYLYPRKAGAHVPRAESADFKGMRQGLAVIHKARKAAHVDEIRREQMVVQAISLGLCALVIYAQVREGRLLPEPEDMRRLNMATGMASEAAQHTAEAMTKYLDAIRREAAEYPILTLLGPREVPTGGFGPLCKAIDEAVADSVAACERLMAEGAGRLVVPESFASEHAMTPSRLAKRVAEASVLSVFKVPFFLERAIQTLPARDAEDVDRVLGLAAELESGKAIAGAVALGGIETAMLAAPAAGPVGVAIAVQWALVEVVRSVHEYGQLKALFEASIDPRLFLRGLEHEPASRLSILFSLLGLIVV